MAAAMTACSLRAAGSVRPPAPRASAGRTGSRAIVARSSSNDGAKPREAMPGALLSAAGLSAAAVAAPARADEAVSAVAEATEAAVEAVEKVVEAVEAAEAAAMPIDAGAITAAVQEAEAAVKTAAAAASKASDSPVQVEKLVSEATSALKDAAAAAVSEASASTVAEQAASATSISADLGTAQEAMQAAAKAAAGAGADKDVVEALQGAVSAIADAAKEVQEVAGPAIKAAEPAVRSAVSFLSTTDPAVLAEYALAVVAAGWLLPPLAKASLDSLRGYAGDVQPTSALDALVSQGGNALVDIRSAAEKEATGVPDLADPAKLVELEFVAVDDSRLSERLRNSMDVEAESTAIQIAALKQLNKGMTLYIMDTSGDLARSVAKELTRRGFSKCFVLSGGAQAWTAAKLRTKPWSAAAALLPEKGTASWPRGL